jgi:hypothetical protein
MVTCQTANRIKIIIVCQFILFYVMNEEICRSLRQALEKFQGQL